MGFPHPQVWFGTALLWALLGTGCSRQAPENATAADSPATLTTECYVWQQSGGPALDAAIIQAAGTMDAFYLHGADVTFDAGNARKVITFPAPWQAVKDSGERAGLVIRVPSARGGLGNYTSHAGCIAELARELAPAGTELQIDYDCPASKLELYASFLTKLHQLYPDGPLVFTALPSWLDAPAFPSLARSADGYVLQVHSLELPPLDVTEVKLCDPAKARRAVERATRLGLPFRVALPTYCSVLVREATTGQVRGVISEGLPNSDLLGDNLQRVPGRSPAPELAVLVAEWQSAPPPHLTGIVWYRLPVEGDRMNWTWPTLEMAATGKVPASRLEARVEADPKGFYLIRLVNTGQTSEPLPAGLRVSWPRETRFDAADALGPYQETRSPTEQSRQLELREAPLYELAPGQEVAAGWIRVESPAALRVEILP